jgi:hypothetical protein
MMPNAGPNPISKWMRSRRRSREAARRKDSPKPTIASSSGRRIRPEWNPTTVESARLSRKEPASMARIAEGGRSPP